MISSPIPSVWDLTFMENQLIHQKSSQREDAIGMLQLQQTGGRNVITITDTQFQAIQTETQSEAPKSPQQRLIFNPFPRPYLAQVCSAFHIKWIPLSTEEWWWRQGRRTREYYVHRRLGMMPPTEEEGDSLPLRSQYHPFSRKCPQWYLPDLSLNWAVSTFAIYALLILQHPLS